MISSSKRKEEELKKIFETKYFELQNSQQTKEQELINENDKLNQQIYELTQENQNLRNDYKISVEEFNQKNAEKIAAMEDDVIKLKNQLTLKERRLKHENVILSRKYEDLETQSQRLFSTYQSKITKLTQNKIENEAKIKFLQKSLLTLQNKIKSPI